jgi:hypothetical protein
MRSHYLLAAAILAGCSGDEFESSVPPASQAAHFGASGEDEALVRNTYNIAHDVCTLDPDQIYSKAGSRSVHEAAEWYSRISREGPHQAASYRGCADALMGNQKSF